MTDQIQKNRRADSNFNKTQVKLVMKESEANKNFKSYLDYVHNTLTNTHDKLRMDQTLRKYHISTSGSTVLQNLQVIKRHGAGADTSYTWIHKGKPTEELADKFRIALQTKLKGMVKANRDRKQKELIESKQKQSLSPVQTNEHIKDNLTSAGIAKLDKIHKFLVWLYPTLDKVDWTDYTKLRTDVKNKIKELQTSNIVINSLETAKIVEKKNKEGITYIRWRDLSDTPSIEMASRVRDEERNYVKSLHLNTTKTKRKYKTREPKIKFAETSPNHNINIDKKEVQPNVDNKQAIIKLAKQFALLNEYEFAYNLLEPLTKS